MDQVSKNPLDFDKLQKGEVIPVETLEEIFVLSRDDPKFQLKALALRQRIMEEMRERGMPATVKIENKSLRILTDPEAANYTTDRFHAALGAAQRWFVRETEVDITQLNESERAEHLKELEKNARYVQAITHTQKIILVEGHKKSVRSLESKPDGNGTGQDSS